MPSHNPFYDKHEDTSINSFDINHIDQTSDDNFSTSTRDYQTKTIEMLDSLDLPSPYKIGRPHSPFSFNSDAFSPLFENLSSQGSAYDCLSTSTGDFLLRSPSNMSDTPYRLDKMHVPNPTDTTLDPIHHVPFLSHSNELDSRTNPRASLLYYADANLDDRVNGPITMRNLPSCVDASITAASFCLRYISSSAATQACIRDLTTDHLRHLFRDLFPLLSIGSDTIDTSHGNIEYIQCLQHTFNRTINLVTDNMTSEQLSHFPNGPPSTFHDLMLKHLPGSLGHQCSLSILYAFKMSYQCHFLISSPFKNDAPDYLPPNLTDIVRNVPTFATALRLFPNRSNFRDIPAFIHTFFNDKQVSTNPFDKKQEEEYNKQDQEPPSHLVLITMIAFMHSPLVNGFGHPTPMSPQTSQVARSIISRILYQHANLQNWLTTRQDQHLNSNIVILGSLPPADMILNHHCSSFPIVTLPTPHQLATNLYRQTSPNILAVNFAICNDLTPHDLQRIHIPTEGDDITYTNLKSYFKPIKCDTHNNSIDFLPDSEYRLFRVVQTIPVCDPQCVLPQTPKPTNVLIYQGSLSATGSYTAGSTTVMPIPEPTAHIFPIIYDLNSRPIIFNHANGSIEPYSTTTIQSLFTTQACIPMNSNYEANPNLTPNNPSQLWRQNSPVHHVIDDPTTIPFALAVRLHKVITAKRGDTDVYLSWALPHLEHALVHPDNQLTHNRYSYFWHQHNHPEYPYLNATSLNSPLNIIPGTSSQETSPADNLPITHDVPNPFCRIHKSVIQTKEDRTCDIIRYQLKQQQYLGKHTAFLAVTTRSSTEPGNPPAPNPELPDNPSTDNEESTTDTANIQPPPIQDPHGLQVDTSQQEELIPEEQDTPIQPSNVTNPLQRLSRAVTQILTPRSTIPSSEDDSTPQNPQVSTTTSATAPPENIPEARNTPEQPSNRPPKHPTFAYPPIHETYFDNDSDNERENEDPPQIPLASPDALTSSTRTDFTYPPVEDLTRTLLKYAKNANLRKLSYPTDLASRRRQFNTFMDNVRIVCNISPWTRQVFSQWPKQICYSHPFVGTAIYNLIFTNVSDPCQKLIIDGPPDARTAILTLRRHCAPLTQDHTERTREAFCAIKQAHQEVATSYLNRIRTLTRDCYHAGIPNTDAELIKRAIRGGSNHHFYAASYQRFDADLRRAELNDEELPPFSELESYLLNIDESRGLTLPTQNQRNYNQHANTARPSPTLQPIHRSSQSRQFTPRQQQALSSTLRPYTQSNQNRQSTNRPNSRPPNGQTTLHSRPTNQPSSNNRRPFTPSFRSNNPQSNGSRPSFRPSTPMQNANNHRRPQNNATPIRRNPTNGSSVICNNCGRQGHFARNCPTRSNRSQPTSRGPNPRPPNNNNNAPPFQRAYFVADSSSPATSTHNHRAFLALTTPYDLHSGPSSLSWPDENAPQMEINHPLLQSDFMPTTSQAPPNTGGTEFFPDDPTSPYQRFGPPHLDNWLPDSGATCHYTPIFSDLCNVEECHIPVSLADGSTKISTHKGTTNCLFTTTEGQKSILGLTDVYYIEGLSHRLLSLTAISATQNFTVIIKNRATTLQFPNNHTYTWPLMLHEIPSEQAFSTTAQTNNDPGETSITPIVETTDDEFQETNTPQATTTLPLELMSRRLAHRNFRNLMTGSLHNAWKDHILSPAIDTNTWPVRISISQKRARNKTPMRQGTEPFHQLHLDLMRNPFRFGLTTSTNFSAYLFIVTTPGKLTGWIGLPTESTASILAALQTWLTQTELLGRTQSVRFIRTDAGTAFTSEKFTAACTKLGIKLEAAAPEHQEMNGICEAKWREVHNTANTLLNTARLGGAFFHHAHAYAVQIINSCPAKNVTDQDGNPTTPFNYSYGRKPSLTNFRVFGCPLYFKRYEPTFRNKIITYKQQLQRASRGIFIGFPENSAGWLVYSSDHPQRIVITRDAYFDEDFSSALAFDSKPFAGAIPIRSHLDPNGLTNIDNSEPSIVHQTGSAANLGIRPSTFMEGNEDQQTTAAEDNDEITENDVQPGPTPPNPHFLNFIQHQRHHTPLQKDMNLYFQECSEPIPSFDPIQTAMLAIDTYADNSKTNEDLVDKYLPEPQSLKAVLKLDPDVRTAWLHAIKMEIKNLIDHNTFILGEQPRKEELIIPVKLVLKAKQTATGNLDKLKARLVARGDMEKRRIKKTKAVLQQQIQQQRQDIAENKPTSSPHVQPIEIPQPFEDTWSPCASSRGVKLLLSTICASSRTLKSADFIGAYLQAKVIGRHFVRLPLEYAYHFPEYAKYFGLPLLLNKGIYGLVYSGKYWNIEFSEWLYSQGFIQSQSEPSYFVLYNKHNQWLRLLFFVDDMLYAGSNDAIEKEFEDSVRNRFDVKFLGPAQWFLQMRIHQHKDSTYTLDQHRYVLNTLQRYDPNAEFPQRETPFPPDYIFSKDNRPVNSNDKALIEKQEARLPFRSAVCTLLYLAYNTRADILFAVCKLAKACICPGATDYRALTWLIGYLRRRPNYAIKFYPESTSNPIYEICRHHRIPYSDLTVFSDASWQDCPDTGRSTVGYMIFHNGALIEANSTMPTPIAMSTSEAEYMAACSASMATAHIRMLLYDMIYLGTKQWRESAQRLPTIPSILMIDNEATVQIAKNGKLTRKTRHIERRFHFVRQGQQDGSHQLHWIPCASQLADILTKTQVSSKIDPHLTKIFATLPSHLTSPPLSAEI